MIASAFGLGAATLGIAILIGVCVAGMVELADGCFSRARAAKRAAPTAGSPGCTCEPRFYPDALDAACPVHGIPSFLRDKFARSEQGIAS